MERNSMNAEGRGSWKRRDLHAVASMRLKVLTIKTRNLYTYRSFVIITVIVMMIVMVVVIDLAVIVVLDFALSLITPM
jgi:hypothetical protein